VADRIFRFGPFEVDVRRRELRRNGAVLDVPAKAFDALVYLIDHRDRVVARDELISAVWGRSDISDNLLAQSVLRVRRALDDNGNAQTHVRTVTGTGYRWVGELEDAASVIEPVPVAAPSPAPSIGAVPSVATSSTPSPRRRTWLAAIIAIAFVCALVWMLRDRAPSVPRASAGASLALVLPATVHDDDASWLRLGIMDLLARRLNDIGVGTVPSESVVALTKDAGATKPVDLDELRTTTGAATTLASEVARDGTRWTVSLRAERSDGEPVLARGENADVFAAADAAVGQVITQLYSVDATVGAEAAPADSLVRRANAAMLADQYDEAKRLIGAAPADQRNDPRVRLMLARMALIEGHHEDARLALTKLLDDDATKKNPVAEAKTLTLLAGAYLRLNRFADSEKAASQSIDLLRANASPVSASDLGAALIARATARSAQDDVENALADFGAARAALAGTGNVRLEAIAEVNASVMQIGHGHYGEAVDALVRSADLFRRLRIPSNELTARMNLLTAYVYLQNTDAAAAEEPRVDALVARSADPNVGTIARMMCAQSAVDRGELRQAETYLAAISRSDAEVFARFEGQMLALEAQIALARGDAATARMKAAKAVSLPWSSDEPRFEARAWWALVEADRASAPDHGKATATHAAEWAAKETEPVAAFYERLIGADYSAATSSPETKARYEAALASATRIGAPIDLVAVTSNYANWLIDRHELARAREVLQRNEAWASMSYPIQTAYARLHRETGDEPSWRASLERAQTLARERTMPDTLAHFGTGASSAPARSR
jgi:DNA-binding winged helix-turn-helix (wHTH) protein/tetratricopeptide (TPR) repeat protein